MGKTTAGLDDFVAITPQILLGRASDTRSTAPRPEDPKVTLIFGWGNALPKHVTKYTDGYRQLYPAASQIVILSEIATTLFGDLPYRSRQMGPLVKAVVEELAAAGQDDQVLVQDDHVLVHCMSNTGGIKYAAFLRAYRETEENPFPHSLLVFDSAPGSPYLTLENLARFSKAMTINTASWFPWPAIITQFIWMIFLVLNRTIEVVRRKQSASVFSSFATNDGNYETKQAHRLCLYGQGDALISWKDIENHAAVARGAGYKVGLVDFGDSGHVAHMRTAPEKYWSSIEEAWKESSS